MNDVTTMLLIAALLVPVTVSGAGCVEAPSGRFRPAFAMSMQHGCREARGRRQPERWVETVRDDTTVRSERHRSAPVGDADIGEVEPEGDTEQAADSGDGDGGGGGGGDDGNGNGNEANAANEQVERPASTKKRKKKLKASGAPKASKKSKAKKEPPPESEAADE